MGYRLLLDENVDRAVGDRLAALGHDVERVADVDELGARTPDEALARYSTDEERAILTHDDDFVTTAHGAHAVLVVDDEETADLYTEFLTGDYAVRTAYPVEAALEMVDSTVGVVLSDRRTPGLSGDEVFETIRTRDLDCRVVMTTAVSLELDVLGLPFDDYLVNPVPARRYATRVRRYCDATPATRRYGRSSHSRRRCRARSQAGSRRLGRQVGARRAGSTGHRATGRD